MTLQFLWRGYMLISIKLGGVYGSASDWRRNTSFYYIAVAC